MNNSGFLPFYFLEFFEKPPGKLSYLGFSLRTLRFCVEKKAVSRKAAKPAKEDKEVF